MVLPAEWLVVTGMVLAAGLFLCKIEGSGTFSLILFPAIRLERSALHAFAITELLAVVNGDDKVDAGKILAALDTLPGVTLFPTTEWVDVVQRGVVHMGVTLTEGQCFADSGMPYDATK